MYGGVSYDKELGNENSDRVIERWEEEKENQKKSDQDEVTSKQKKKGDRKTCEMADRKREPEKGKKNRGGRNEEDESAL